MVTLSTPPDTKADAVAILQRLIRFDTTNPPGNEGDCSAWIKGLLDEAGIPARILERTPGRPNLVARLSGQGAAPPLLLYGHVDVVPTAGQPWSRDPFSGELVDGLVWGRGALDMKSGVAMILAALLRAKAEGTQFPGDVILALVCDEEAGGLDGAGHLVTEHADLFRDVRYALGEFGGFPIPLAGKRFYAIQVAEKSMCSMRLVARGKGGHASMPEHGGAVGKLARAVVRLDAHRTPIHIVDAVRLMVEAIAEKMPDGERASLLALLDPDRTDRVLDSLGPSASLIRGCFRNTFSPTILRAGDKINVIPREATAEVDGRLLPGFTADDAVAEVRAALGDAADDVEIQVVEHQPGPAAPKMGLFDTLAGTLREMDPEAEPIPYFLFAVTDARWFAQLGIQTYGFLPLNLPDDMNFIGMVHNADERVPASAVEFGAEAVFRVLSRFHG